MKVAGHSGLQAIGWIAAYVLALHTLLSGFAAPMTPTAHPAGAAIPCLSSSTAPAGGSDTPSRPHASDHPCGCFLTGTALPPAPAEARLVSWAVPAYLSLLRAGPDLPVAKAEPTALPRAPPPLA